MGDYDNTLPQDDAFEEDASEQEIVDDYRDDLPARAESLEDRLGLDSPGGGGSLPRPTGPPPAMSQLRPPAPGLPGANPPAQAGATPRPPLPGSQPGASPSPGARPPSPGQSGPAASSALPGALPPRPAAPNPASGVSGGLPSTPKPSLPGQTPGQPSGGLAGQRPPMPGSAPRQPAGMPAQSPPLGSASGSPGAPRPTAPGQQYQTLGGALPGQPPRPAPVQPAGGTPSAKPQPAPLPGQSGGARPQPATSPGQQPVAKPQGPPPAANAGTVAQPLPVAPRSAPGQPKSPTRPGGGSHAPRKSGAAAATTAGRVLPSVEHTIRQRVATAGDGSAQPDLIARIQGVLPSFSDEVAALALIGIGLLSFFTLLSPSSGTLGMAWSGTLRQTFGIGSFVVSGVILTAGALILVPKLGVEVRLNWWRFIAGEFLFLFLLGFVHLWTRVGFTADLAREEAIAAALEGRGGGYVGWAVQEAFNAVFGDVITGLALITLSLIAGGIAFGVSRYQMVEWLEKAKRRLISFAWRMEGRRLIRLTAAEETASPAISGSSLQALAGTREVEPGMAEITVGGRPSVVTGETTSGPATVMRPVPALTRTSPVRLSLRHDEDKPKREINYRFTLHETPDKKKLRKRSADLPPLELLDVTDYMRPTEDEINLNAEIIEETVQEFGMTVQVIGVKSGPTVTQYAVQPFSQVEQGGQQVVVQRVRVTRVAALSQDLSLALAAPRVRIQAPVPGTSYIGVEVPNSRPGIVSLRPVIESERFFKIKSPLTVALGREVDGKAFAADLATMPHMLIGGTTGSGKSVCLAAITTCLVANNRPDEMRLIMIDPKMVELIRFNGLPHLYGKVEVDLERIIGVLRWVTREMDRRYKLMEEAQARNIIVYNEKKKKKDRFPYIVVLIDELAELMTEYPDETEHLLTRLAQMARATGIHLVVATQRPSTEVVTGLIKANFPARIAFAVASGVDSRVIIDSVGAEELIGRGDMLFYASDAAGPIRLQGCFASDGEMERVVEFWRENWQWDESEAAPWERSLTRAQMLDETDSMLEEAIKVIQKEGEASASLLQRKLNVSYPRAGRLIDALYKIGVVGEPMQGGKSRLVLIAPNVDPTNYIITWRGTHQP